MQAVSNLACPSCGRNHDEHALVCGLCGTLLRRESAVDAPREHAGDARPMLALSSDPSSRALLHREHLLAGTETRRSADSETSTREPWLYLAIGLVTAPIFAWTPILRFMGWFLASLVHEMGHSAFAWLCGMPAFPAISLEGHAAAMHSEQVVPFTCLIGIGLALAAWRWLAGSVRWIAIALVVVIYPVIAFTSAKELLHLLAGHGGELVFATLCLWKTLHGGFTESRVERALYGTVGWYLLGKNVSMCWGLMRSSAARVEYYNNGSFGMTNDYIRVAEDVLGCRLQSVALAMLVLALCVLPAAIGLWRTTYTASASEVELDG